MTNVDLLGVNIRRLRQEKELSQERLGELVGRGQDSISYYELGHKRPALPVLLRLAQELGVTVDDLFRPTSPVN